jgi:hypothetical protein
MAKPRHAYLPISRLGDLYLPPRWQPERVRAFGAPQSTAADPAMGVSGLLVG